MVPFALTPWGPCAAGRLSSIVLTAGAAQRAAPSFSQPRFRAPHWSPGRTGLSLGALAAALLLAVPVAVIVASLALPRDEVWEHVGGTVLPQYVANTALLLLGVGAGVLVLGTAAAWLVTMCRFPGSRTLEWALLLPMAMPAYLMAYTYTDLLDVTGPVQTALRAWTGLGVRQYWFPPIRSLGGAIAVMALVFYPYVYLLARAAFLEQSVCVLEASRTLGRGPWRSFLGVALPLARPALVAGLTLALMEALADFGTVEYFAVDTFTTGIFRSWFGMDSRLTAAQLAALLLLAVLAVKSLERLARGGARFHHTSLRYRHLVPYRLRGLRALAALLVCAAPVILGFFVPAGALARLSLTGGDRLAGALFPRLAANSLLLAALAGALAVLLSVAMAASLRFAPGWPTRIATAVATLGYAVPGSVIAVGVLATTGFADNALDRWMRAAFNHPTGLLLSGTIVALVFAYLVRFLAVAFHTVEAGLSKIRPSMEDAARTLGRGPLGALAAVHAPLMRGSVLTAGLLVFVEVMKELPATLIVRPFNFDTLAVRVYRLAADERLAEASTPALAIVAVGVLPVVLLSIAIARSRAGNTAAA
ncbi:MAG: Ferric iron ABC transporter, permease protein [uncultured Chloroflexi bacterium]|uniref:Ferric iron ABC transporter, permease protein n=1 Tax=uncultured Chloroflexota bacterium TaxID=166587 RepID=A0A6J4HI50_9CHLR|nr:MAG: Ferric iron ABC transporter, permease protein [uncultured Chloroflexota bacterium]